MSNCSYRWLHLSQQCEVGDNAVWHMQTPESKNMVVKFVFLVLLLHVDQLCVRACVCVNHPELKLEEVTTQG